MAADPRVRDLLRRIDETNGTPEEVCGDCPELLPEVRQRWTKLRALKGNLDAFFPTPTERGDDEGDPRMAAAPQFPAYDIAASLGSGGMGAVYKAIERATGRVVALKVVHPHLRGLPGFIERLTREAEIGRQVVHENVVRTLGLTSDASQDPARQALVTEFVEGQTLRALLAEMGRLPEPLCRHVGREMAKGLAAIHAVGAVHRDLKPENVIVSTPASGDTVRQHVVKVMDLGIARVLDVADGLSQPGAFVGSLRYAAPEQLRRGSVVDGRADVHALGLVLFELVTGREAPVGAGGLRPRASEVTPGVTPFLDEFIAECLRENPDERFARASDMARILDEGESSGWWTTRAVALHARTPRVLGNLLGRRETLMVGRDAEVRRLAALFESASAAQGRVVLVEGEAGIGKSRLVQEFASLLLRDATAEVLVGGYAPGGAATAMEAFSTALRERLGEPQLEESLRRHLEAGDDLVASFAALLRGVVPPAGSPPLTKETLHTAYVRTVQSLSRSRPVVLVIEDLHFAPEGGRALFAALTSAIAAHAVLLVGTARRSLDQRWATELARAPHVSRLSIGRLAESDVAALMGEVLGTPDLAAEFAAKLSDRTDGNPYFVFETLRDLRETHLLARRADGAWAATRALVELRVAPSIGDLIRARVAALSAEERELLNVAACCGFEFDPRLLGDALGLDRFTLLRRLGILETDHGLIRASGRRHSFEHHNVQEVVHETMSDLERETFHAAIATTLESRAEARRSSADVTPADCVPLADHFLRGGSAPRALPYLNRALHHLLGDFHYDAAIRMAARALSADEVLVGAERCKVALLQARALSLPGRSAEESAALAEAVRAARTSGDRVLLATALRETGAALFRTSHSSDARSAFEEAERLFSLAGDRAGEATVIRHLGVLHLDGMRLDEAAAHFERSRTICREIGDRRGEGQAVGNLATALRTVGRGDESMRLNREQIAIATEVGDPQARLRGMSNLGTELLFVGRFDESIALQEDSVRAARRIGDRYSEATTLCSLAVCLKAVGRLGEARTHLERSVALLTEIDSRRGMALVMVCLGDLHLTVGALEAAAITLRRGREVAQAIGLPMAEIQAEVRLAELSASERRLSEALAMLDRCGTLAEELRVHETAAMAHLRRGAVLTELGRTAESVDALDRAIAVARDGELRSMLVIAAAERARRPGGDPGYAAALLDQHGDRIELVEKTLANWRLWQVTADPRRLAEAKRLLQFLVEHAPADARVSIVENVAVHREIAAAAEPPATGGAPRRG